MRFTVVSSLSDIVSPEPVYSAYFKYAIFLIACSLAALSGVSFANELAGWAQHLLPPNGEDLYDVDQGNGVWVFVGNEGTIFRSTDGGVTQNSVTSPTSNAIVAVRHGANVWLAGDAGGSVLRSTDGGLTWTSTVVSGLSSIRDVHYANGVWILVGPSGKIFRSVDDGLSWTEVATPTTRLLSGIYYADGVWIAIGANRTNLRSIDDGLTWSNIDVSNLLTSGTPLNAVASSAGGTWIAGGGVNTGVIIKSTDGGLTWTARDVSGSRAIQDIEFAEGEWRAVGDSGTLITSVDGGETWSYSKPADRDLKGIAWGGGHWLIAGRSNTLLGSDGGNPFSLLTPRIDKNLYGISHNGTYLVTVGEGGMILRSNTNGAIWWNESNSLAQEDYHALVDNEGSSWAAVGGIGNKQTTFVTNNNFSTSGSATATPLAPLNDVGLSGTTLVAVGGSGAIRRQLAISSFGTDWRYPYPDSGISQALNSVVAGNGVWIAVGNGGSIIKSLDDAQTWSSQVSITSASLRGIAYDPLEACWRAVGEGGVLIQSYDDGATWSLGQIPTSEDLENVVFDNSAWMIMGANGTLLYSTDQGSTWSSQALGVAVTLRDATYRNGEWWVVGDNGTVFQSSVTHPSLTVEQPADAMLVNGQSTVDFGGVFVASSEQRVFTVRNTGSANLTGLSLSIAGSQADDFSVVPPVAAPLAPGEAATFTVSFTPSAHGSRTTRLRIASNDADENPFNIDLSGLGLAPEIAVEEPVGTGLTDGVSTIDFGAQLVGAAAVRVVRIRNLGTSPLTGLSPSVTGPHAAEFTAGLPPITTLAPGGSTTFSLTFHPMATGARSAILHVASNDGDENPFDIDLSGTGTTPEIEVNFNGNELVSGAAGVNFGDVVLGSSSSAFILTVKNATTATADLSSLEVTRDGANAADFMVSGLGATTLAPGESTTFSVTFSPGATGQRVAGIHIASSDVDENPFDISLFGTGVVPDIVVEQPSGTNLTDGVSTIDIGAQLVAANAILEVTIRNAGTSPLTGLSANVTGPQAGAFTVGSPATSALAPGESTTFSLTFHPTSTGAHAAGLQITSNDPDENPFDIALTGVGVTPEIEVTLDGNGLTDGSADADFGIVLSSEGSKELTFTIRNTGDAPLTGLSASFTGPNATDFSAGSLGASLAPSASRSLTVTLTPSALGDLNAVLHLASSDLDESPFDISLRGTSLERTSLRSWGETFGLAGDELLTTADDDGDFISLLEEYAFNLDPTVAEFSVLTPGTGTGGLPSIRLVGSGAGRHLKTEFIRRRGDPNLTYTVEYGSDLSELPPDGFSAADQLETVTGIDLEFDRVIVHDSKTLGTDRRRFGRVKLEYAEEPE